MCDAPSRRVYQSASASTRRPSASVLTISIVFPFAARRMSPGRNASPPGRFSAAASTAIARTGSCERGDGADAVQRPRAARHVAFHVLHLRGGLQGDAAGVEGDRLADEPERDVGARDLRRVVAQHDQARLVAAAASDGGERAHAELVHLARPEDLRFQVLMLAGKRLRVLGERMRVELVRRHVREVACAIRVLGEQRCTFRRLAELGRVFVTDHDPLDRARTLVDILGLPLAGRVAAEDRALDECARLRCEREREALVEEPAEAAADARERLRGGGSGGPERIRVELIALAETGGDDARCVERAVRVQEQRLAPVAPELAALGRAGAGGRRASRRRSARPRRKADG